MVYIKTALFAAALCAAHLGDATAQQRASFSRWTAPAPAVTSERNSALTLPDSVLRKVGYQQWKGAAIGGGVGAVLGSVLAFGLAGRCDDCTDTTWDRAQAALVITGASSALGFLVGLASPRYGWTPSPGLGEE
jgi:hypothetical protein